METGSRRLTNANQIKRTAFDFRFLAASIFLTYHTLAICLAPAPDSYLRRKVAPFFEPYLKIFHLNNNWGYFAPDPASGILMRYRIEDEDGKMHVFKLTENLKRSDPDFMRMTSLFNKMPGMSPAYLQGIASYLCGRNSAIKPVRLQFMEGHQVRLSPWAWFRGKRPMDDEYMRLKLREWRMCKAS